MVKFRTEQEEFWAGEFGDNYIERNNTEQLLQSNIHFFSNILKNTHNTESVMEFGANIGLNLKAIRSLYSDLELSAVEINQSAVKELDKIENIKVYPQSILDFKVDYQRDFVFTKTVLIHLNPKLLENAYEIIYKTSKRYICVAEYYNPTPVEVNYRGFNGKLFKRDFAGELMKKYEDLKLVEYGFVYNQDKFYPQDDITWFLLEK